MKNKREREREKERKRENPIYQNKDEREYKNILYEAT